MQRKTIDRNIFLESDYPEIIDIIFAEDEYKSDEALYKGYIGVIEEIREWLHNNDWEKECTGGMSQHEAKMIREEVKKCTTTPYYLNGHRFFICKICKRLIIDSFISEVDSKCPTRGICIQCKKD